MSKIVKTAAGKKIDMDSLMLRNETTIAVGNTKKNARGDLLGPGGKIIKTRDQIMKEYYALNTPVATDPPMVAEPLVNNTTKLTADKTSTPVNPESGLDESDVVIPAPIPKTTKRK